MIQGYEISLKETLDHFDLYNLAIEENNKIVAQDSLKKLQLLSEQVKKNELKCYLSKEHDSFSAYLEIHAGAGGTESQDWAEMLRRMYLKWSSD